MFALVVCVLANTDYYSVLGVKRGVNEKDLKKACTLFLSLSLSLLGRGRPRADQDYSAIHRSREFESVNREIELF